jgi:membrane fusion protein, heavy metal efflux system
LLDRETRNARVIASLPNPDHRWKPGTFITAEIPLGDAPAKVIVPRGALQTVKGAPTLFVRDKDGFAARQVKTGREDDDDVEIISGLAPGETYAVANSFTLKAELEKAEASEGEH